MTRTTWMLVCLLAATAVAAAQVERVLPRKGASSLEGTAFAVGFMQNEVSGVGTPPRLQIFISSQYDARVRINYPAAPFEQIRLIPANTVFVEDVLSVFEATSSEFVDRKMIEITSDVPIVVYVLNTLATSTDTYTAIPIKHLGTQYLTVNMPTDHYRARSTDPALDTARRTSEFMVMAVEDRTTVEITPRVRTKMNRPPNVPFTVRLDSGETFLVQAAETALGYGDLSGSRINATKNVAVLSGHMRSSVPTNISSSKDHLVEMLPPLQTWGKEYATTPFAVVEGGDEVRLMTADYDTHIEIVTEEGIVDQWFTQPGEWRDINISRPALYRSDKPFFVMQFMPSSRPVDGTNPYYDPAMVVVPPLDQYVEGALFQFPVLDSIPELGDIQRFYYFINVVADSVCLPSLRVNEWLVRTIAPEIDTQRIPGTNLHWATIRFVPDAYTITADTGLFSGVMYGASYADSYANLFGVAYERLPQDDRTPPVYALAVDCGEVDGTITDVSSLGSPLLTEVTVKTEQTFNYRWAISNPTDAIGTTQFSAWVRDMSEDAQIVIHAYDDVGNGREWMYRYDAPQFEFPAEVVLDVSTGQRTCVTIPVVNTDSTPGRVRSIQFTGDPRYSVVPTTVLDSLVAPGDTLHIQICFDPDTTTRVGEGAIAIDLGCGLEYAVDVVTRTTVSLNVPDHDFGDVRVGDTVCTDLPIVNNGVVEITIRSIAESLGQAFFVSGAGVTLPTVLQPGDTLWVSVCYTPETEEGSRRTDTVHTEPELARTMTYTGRGVRPRVPPLVIDWGRRRVGTRHDTTGTLINIGSGQCVLEPGVPIIGETAFDAVDLTSAGPVSLDPAELLSFVVAFAPDRVGPIADTIPISVDWDQHTPVYVVLMGEGVDAQITAYDIDMGEVLVGSRKDSIVNYLTTDGDVPVTISSVAFSGADQTAFVVDPQISGLTSLPATATITGDLSFLPSREGPHFMMVAVVHDAGPSDEDTAWIRISGVGVVEPTYALEADLSGPAVIPACTRAAFDLVVRNSGSTQVTLDSILVTFAGVDTVIVDPAPELAIAEERRYRVAFAATRGMDGAVVARVFADDSVELVRVHSVQIVSEPPSVAATIDPEAAPGDQVGIRVSVEEIAIRDLPEMIVIDLIVDEDRWYMPTTPLEIRVVDVNGPRVTTASVIRAGQQITVSLDEPVNAPYTIEMTAVGQPLWKDTEPILIDVAVRETECGEGAADRVLLTVDVCGGDLRSILFDALPTVRVTVLGQPVRDELRLQFESSHETQIRLDLLSLTGQRYPVVDKFPLQKGIHHCNFLTSNRAAGFYGLVVGYGSGEFILPVVLVK